MDGATRARGPTSAIRSPRKLLRVAIVPAHDRLLRDAAVCDREWAAGSRLARTGKGLHSRFLGFSGRLGRSNAEQKGTQTGGRRREQRSGEERDVVAAR